MRIEPVQLGGAHVRLVPLREEHIPGLVAVGLEEELWRWMTAPVRSAEEMAAEVRKALEDEARGVSLPFCQIEAASGRVIGSTRYLNIERAHRRLEIGHTWIAAPWRRTAVNTEAKYLLLRHAFEALGCIRVELKTDSLNERSRAAIARIGARQEGIFRNHMITASGRIRHSVYFSIVDGEWPEVKAALESKLRR